MNRIVKIFLVAAAASFLLTGQNAAAGAPRVATLVKVINAATGTAHMDPRLGELGPELKSIFKYNSYRLLNERRMNLEFGKKGKMRLPEGRVLEIIPREIKGGRIRFNIKIGKGGKRGFATEIRLKNGSSITIGGPRIKKGYLLLNISGSTR